MKCTYPNCRESTRWGANRFKCWSNQMCPKHFAISGGYAKAYNANSMPFRKRTRPR